ncbi:MAG: PQQ-dependent sugar dehydrogenase [Planctomycetales bacterium]|nr:PQQ-dependent sugar dehydrogenase [Planctomycetales bacterium]
MRRSTLMLVIVPLWWCSANNCCCFGAEANSLAFDADRFERCTTNRVEGTPDPPLPYRSERWRAELDLPNCIFAAAEPGRDRLLVVLQNSGSTPSKIVRIREDSGDTSVETLLELPRRIIYSLAFHPQFRRNGLIYLGTNGPTDSQERTDQILRFHMTADGQVDAKSELPIIQWRSMGHDGAAIAFGHDGMMYVTTGDGTSDSDGWLSAQDVTNLLGSVIRIDVDRPDPDRAYSIPRDNPFCNVPGARPELWAIGLRNPWRMCVDRKTGHLWVGNNGQDLWETVHLIGRGENYGWSVYEGNHPFYAHRQLGPAPFVPPTIEHHHREARSLTGGEVYYGDKFPELEGAYIYGDYSTGKIWGARHDGTRLTWHRELADTDSAIVGFAVTSSGDIVIVDNTNGLQRLVTNTIAGVLPSFPQQLSDTGLFRTVPDHRMVDGVIPFEVNAPGWMDGASAERFLVLPPDGAISGGAARGWKCPEGTVLLQTISLPAQDVQQRRIETRMLHRYRNEWNGYSYLWNDEQSDASLVDAGGADVTLSVYDNEDAANTAQQRVWRVPSRAECMSCHARAVEYVLGLSQPQMNRLCDFQGKQENQIEMLRRIGALDIQFDKPLDELPRLANPYDASEPLDARARSYLHANCSVCHVSAGGGNARMELEVTQSSESMKVVDAHPQHDTLGITDARVVAPGAPERSILYHRISRRGRGQMPPLVSNVIDSIGTKVIHDWIAELKPTREFVRAWTVEELRIADHAADRKQISADRGRVVFDKAGCSQCHRVFEHGGGVGSELTGIVKRQDRDKIIESILLPSRVIVPEFAMTVVHTHDGNVLRGRVVSEDSDAIRLQPPSSFSAALRIAKSEIEERRMSSESAMPAGLLNTWELPEILDLLAYVTQEEEPSQPAAPKNP